MWESFENQFAVQQYKNTFSFVNLQWDNTMRTVRMALNNSKIIKNTSVCHNMLPDQVILADSDFLKFKTDLRVKIKLCHNFLQEE